MELLVNYMSECGKPFLVKSVSYSSIVVQDSC